MNYIFTGCGPKGLLPPANNLKSVSRKNNDVIALFLTIMSKATPTTICRTSLRTLGIFQGSQGNRVVTHEIQMIE